MKRDLLETLDTTDRLAVSLHLGGEEGRGDERGEKVKGGEDREVTMCIYCKKHMISGECGLTESKSGMRYSGLKKDHEEEAIFETQEEAIER